MLRRGEVACKGVRVKPLKGTRTAAQRGDEVTWTGVWRDDWVIRTGVWR